MFLEPSYLERNNHVNITPFSEEEKAHASSATTPHDFRTQSLATILLNETLVDAFSYLSRDDIDLLAQSSRKFRDLTDGHMRTTSLRALQSAALVLDTGRYPPVYRTTIIRYCPSLEAVDEDNESGTKEIHFFCKATDAVECLLRWTSHSVIVGSFAIYYIPLSHGVCQKFAAAGMTLQVFLTSQYEVTNS